jgi:serine/threonine protein kinase/flagellar biosynthesis regulator FlbT
MPPEDQPDDQPTHGLTGPKAGEAQASILGELGQGKVVGPYRLLELIGAGGMGEVWLAEQTEPVQRRVALKLIKSGMNTREVVARFESERQALAMMDHPAIAKVFDAGSTRQGQPYFATEYVAGLPITLYADRHRLTMQQRLELFIRVCEGVQHAHQKAIIHRDLKPSNILVSEVDGKPLPRIIDFGIAKATLQLLGEGTVYTQVGAIIGTLGYMSPEQADSGGQDIDTRSDVYSLGVVLYELLVGVLPHNFNRVAYSEVLRCLREDDAPRPSTQVRSLGEESVIAAQNRGANPQTLSRQLRGDADVITLKALEKDRKRRYGSPSDLAADIERLLGNEPVKAHPPSLDYRLRKYVRRHRLGVAIAAAVLLLLIGFSVAQAIALRRITRERDRADRITDFMTGMFKVSDPSNAHGNTVTARELLDKASSKIATGLRNDPVLQASMMHIMGNVYDKLGLLQRAESLVSRAWQMRRKTLGENDPATLNSAELLATIYDDESRYPEAEKLFRETLAALQASLGPDALDSLKAERHLSQLLMDAGRYAESEKMARQVIEAGTRKYGSQDILVRNAQSDLAIDLAQEGKFAEAEKSFRQILDASRASKGSDDPDVLEDMNNLGDILLQEQNYAEAEKMYRETIQRMQRVLGPEHYDTLATTASLASVLAAEKRYDEAAQLYRETFAIQRRRLGDDHRSTLVTAGNLAHMLMDEGKYAEAEQLLRQTLTTEQRKLGAQHSDTLVTMDSLAQVLAREKRLPEAEKTYREVLSGRRTALGADHPYTAGTAYDLACVLAREGKRDEALVNLQFAVDHALNANTRAGLAADPDLNSLHGDARFAAITAQTHPPLQPI